MDMVPTDPPALEPVDLATAKLHLRVTDTAQDAIISLYLKAAREKLESYLSRSFITTGWRGLLDGFPGQYSRFSPGVGTAPLGAAIGYASGLYGQLPEAYLAGTGAPITVPLAKLAAVLSITYLDTNLVRQTLDSSLYTYESKDGARITPAYNHVWPIAAVYPQSVQIEMQVGYGPSSFYVPAVIQHAILLLTGQMYENRESIADVQSFEIPLGLKWLIRAQDWGARP